MVFTVAIVSPQTQIAHEHQRTLSQIPGLESFVIPHEPDIAIRGIMAADIALLHHDLPNDALMRLLRTLLLVPGTTMPVIIGAPDDADVLMTYLEHGTVGYVLADEPPERLCEVVAGVAEGKAFIDPRMATRLIERYRHLRSRLRQGSHVENDISRGQPGSNDE